MEERPSPHSSGQVSINAAPDMVYRVVADPVAMVSFAREVYRVRWLDGATGPRVGARFRGDNRKGLHRWWTIGTITAAEPNRRLAYEIRTPFRVPIARWQYDIEPTRHGCRVTESSWIKVPAWFAPIAIMITGSRDRAAVNTSNIATTLRALKTHIEASPPR